MKIDTLKQQQHHHNNNTNNTNTNNAIEGQFGDLRALLLDQRLSLL
jgi:hypothetical protein